VSAAFCKRSNRVRGICATGGSASIAASIGAGGGKDSEKKSRWPRACRVLGAVALGLGRMMGSHCWGQLAQKKEVKSRVVIAVCMVSACIQHGEISSCRRRRLSCPRSLCRETCGMVFSHVNLALGRSTGLRCSFSGVSRNSRRALRSLSYSIPCSYNHESDHE